MSAEAICRFAYDRSHRTSVSCGQFTRRSGFTACAASWLCAYLPQEILLVAYLLTYSMVILDLG